MKKINSKNYKETLSKFTTGITVVCVKKNKIIFGKTVNSFNSLSKNPPLVLFSLSTNSSNINIFKQTKYLSINILSSEQKGISNLFSKKNPNLNTVKFFENKKNTVFISDSIANLECKLMEKIKKGDHIIFICKILNVQSNNKLKPLNYFNSKYL